MFENLFITLKHFPVPELVFEIKQKHFLCLTGQFFHLADWGFFDALKIFNTLSTVVSSVFFFFNLSSICTYSLPVLPRKVMISTVQAYNLTVLHTALLFLRLVVLQIFSADYLPGITAFEMESQINK